MLRDGQGTWVEDDMKILGMVNEFFKELYSKVETTHPLLPFDCIFPHMEEDQMQSLNQPLINTEIKQDLFSVGSFKALVADSFFAVFYKANWDIVGMAIIDYMKDL